MFRPEANAARFRASAERMAMAQLPEELFLDSLHELIEIDREWIPTTEDGSLYLRPFMYASEVFLGVKPSAEYLYLVIASPVGSYFKGGVRPVSVWVSQDYTRAAPGGTGAAKCGGNYATSLVAQAQAIEHGCDQVVFLDAVERRYVDELGGMNVFFVYDDGSLVTPPLTGTILPGITRDSIITLARDNGLTVVERPVRVSTSGAADAASGRLREAFACGTAAVITPIGRVQSPTERVRRRRGRRRSGHRRPAPPARRHPARPHPGPVRLGAQGPVTRRPLREAALCGGLAALAGLPRLSYASRWARRASMCGSLTPAARA